MSLDGIELNGVPLDHLDLPILRRAEAPPERPSRRCDQCGASGPTVVVLPGLPKPGRFCRSCLTLRDAILGVKVV